MGAGPSHTRMAFHNATNYAFLAATAALTAWTWDTIGVAPLAVGLALEAFWLAIGSRLGGPGRYFAFLRAESDKRLASGGARTALRAMRDEDRRRHDALARTAREIREHCAANDAIGLDLVARELKQIDQLVESFASLAATAARFERYVDASDLNQIEAELRRQEQVVAKIDEDGRALAKDNLATLERRLAKALEVRKEVKQARAQLNLIENTLGLLRDQILTMGSPDELASKIERLSASVDAIAAAEKETAQLSRALDRMTERN